MTSFGLAAIFVIYGSVGVFAVLGSIVFTQRFIPLRWEQPFYGVFLAAIALFYLPFIAYFEAGSALPQEGLAIAVFVVLALAGTRFIAPLILGYALHGAWDFVHELQQHGGMSWFEDGQLTSIPLAYGVFCAVFDFGIATYALMRREQWRFR